MARPTGDFEQNLMTPIGGFGAARFGSGFENGVEIDFAAG
jgi:hypothetical protein